MLEPEVTTAGDLGFCTKKKMHQQQFLDSMPGGGLVGVKTAGWFKGCPPVNRHSLTEAERVSLIAYTNTEDLDWNGAALNAALRSGNPCAAMQSYRDTLTDALAKLPAGPRCVVRRTTLPKTVLGQYQVGGVVLHAGFTSASESRFTDWRDPHLFWIDSTTGKQISRYSAVSNGQEVLFEAGTKFRVTSCLPLNGNRVNFELREI